MTVWWFREPNNGLIGMDHLTASASWTTVEKPHLIGPGVFTVNWGHEYWVLRLLADRMIEFGLVAILA